MSLLIENLRANVGGFEVSLSKMEVQRGELFCLMGKSGSGKSTLLEAIAGFVPLDSGAIYFEKQNLANLPPERRKIAMVFQGAALFPHLTVSENVGFALRAQGVSPEERKTQVNKWLGRLEISELASRYPNQISGGQAQRVALARAFITGFPVLLMDEPFSGIDAELRDQLFGVLKKLVNEESVCVILVTHDPSEAARLANHIALIHDGKITP